jgi:hypothetical protein
MLYFDFVKNTTIRKLYEKPPAEIFQSFARLTRRRAERILSQLAQNRNSFNFSTFGFSFPTNPKVWRFVVS